MLHRVIKFSMVYDANTLKALHPLTDEGKAAYEEMLQEKADEILFQDNHPFKYVFNFFVKKAFDVAKILKMRLEKHFKV